MELRKDKASTSKFDGAILASKELNGRNVIFVSSNDKNEDWILDLKCTFHMMPNKYLFIAFQEVGSGKVLMENGRA